MSAHESKPWCLVGLFLMDDSCPHLLSVNAARIDFDSDKLLPANGDAFLEELVKRGESLLKTMAFRLGDLAL